MKRRSSHLAGALVFAALTLTFTVPAAQADTTSRVRSAARPCGRLEELAKDAREAERALEIARARHQRRVLRREERADNAGGVAEGGIIIANQNPPAGGITVLNGGALNFTGATFSTGGASTLTIASNVSLTGANATVINLAGNLTRSGNTLGTISGTGAGTLTVNSTGTFAGLSTITGATISGNLTLGSGAAGTITLGNGNLTSGVLALNTTNLGTLGNLTLAGVTSGNLTLTDNADVTEADLELIDELDGVSDEP